MNNLKVIEYRNIRVLTTQQIAEASEKERQIKRITEVLHSADTEQLKKLDIFVRTYIQPER